MSASAQALLMGAGDGNWSPASLSPSLWVNDDSSITESGGLVSLWADLSGNGYDLTSASTARPTRNASDLNGLRTLTFDGSNDNMGIPDGANQLLRNQSAAWAMMVVKKTASDGAGTDRVVFAFPTNVGNVSVFRFQLGMSSNNNRPALMVRRLDADSRADLTASADTDTSWHLWLVTIDWSAGDGTVYLDGAQDAQNLSLTSSGSTSNTARAVSAQMGSVAGTLFADMTIAEWLFGVGSIPSSGDIDRLFGYAAHKWGLTANLPSLHPYKTYAP